MKAFDPARTGKRSPVYLATLVLASFLGGCSSLPARDIYTEIDIEAPLERVWGILADNAAYPDWNPYHVDVRGRLEVGEKLQVKLHKPNGERIEIEPRVLRLTPMRELTWGGGVRGIFHGEHVFLLEAIDSANTRVIQKEDFSGIAVPFASLDAIEEGYALMNRALKKLAELR